MGDSVLKHGFRLGQLSFGSCWYRSAADFPTLNSTRVRTFEQRFFSCRSIVSSYTCIIGSRCHSQSGPRCVTTTNRRVEVPRAHSRLYWSTWALPSCAWRSPISALLFLPCSPICLRQILTTHHIESSMWNGGEGRPAHACTDSTLRIQRAERSRLI